jgi:hypothetical protein
MSVDRCLRTIIEETGTQLPKEDVADIVEMLITYQQHPRNRQTFGPFSPEQGRIQDALEQAGPGRLMEARDILMARAQLVAAQQRANVLMDATKRAEREAVYRAAPSADLGFQAKLVGTNTTFLGNRDSAAAAIEGNTMALLGGFDERLKQAGLDRLFASRAIERDWARELHELNRDGGTPGITNNPQAVQLAQIIHDTQRAGVDMVNREGAFIGRYDGYITRTSHSSHLLTRMGEDAWVGLANQHFDLATIYPNRDAAFIDRSLRAQYRRMASGLHDSYDPAEMDLITFAGGQNLARKVSESRVIHFRSADDWLDYMAVASEVTPTQAVFQAGMSAARDAGLMRIWGTNPKRAMETDLTMATQRARDAGDFATVQRLADQRRHFDLWMSYLTGEANHVVNQTRAAIVSNVLSLQRIAKLGFLPFAQITDLASIAGELRYQGVDVLDRLSASTFGYFRGGMNSEKRQVADLLHAYIEGELGQYGQLMETSDPRISGTFTGTLNRIQEMFFRYTGATAMTNRARGSFMVAMARNMGLHHGRAWDAIGAPEQRIMRAFNIGADEWTALNAAQWTVGQEGRTYLTPRDALNIPDTAIEAYALATQEPDIHGNVHFDFAAFRQEMARRLYAYYADRMDYGVLNPGVAERAILYQGAAADTPLGIATRLIAQFKSFTVAQLRRSWGREIYGGQGTRGAVAGLVEFAVHGTVLGIMANGLNQLFKGQDPFSNWKNDMTGAIVKGYTRAGTASMMGDFLVGEFSRNGQSVASYLAGPTVGAVEPIFRMWTKARASYLTGKDADVAGDAVQFAKSVTPLTNSLFTKMAMDYLIWNGLTEMANPGYLRRAERQLKKNQGIEYFRATAPSNLRSF